MKLLLSIACLTFYALSFQINDLQSNQGYLRVENQQNLLEYQEEKSQKFEQNLLSESEVTQFNEDNNSEEISDQFSLDSQLINASEQSQKILIQQSQKIASNQMLIYGRSEDVQGFTEQIEQTIKQQEESIETRKTQQTSVIESQRVSQINKRYFQQIEQYDQLQNDDQNQDQQSDQTEYVQMTINDIHDNGDQYWIDNTQMIEIQNVISQGDPEYV